MHFMHCPQHVGENVEHNMRSVNALRPGTVGFTEMDAGPSPSSGVLIARRILRDYRVCTDTPPYQGEHSQEVPIAVRQRSLTRVQRVSVHQISPLVPPGGVGNDRYLTIVRFRRPFFSGAHVATHTNAAIQGPRGHVLSDLRAEVTALAMRRIEATISTLIREGRQVVVTGDFNYRTYNQPDFTLWRHSPQLTFRRLNMRYHEEGLDYLAYTPGLKLHSPVRVIPTSSSLNQSDHPWLVADLRYSRKAARS